jgi:arylsulfatase A-like enzyme
MRNVIILALLGSPLATVAAQAAGERSNIIVILADDFGWGSLGCYGAPPTLKTPNLDRLSREGRRFTHAYAPGSVCSPTRYGLMTGRYYWRTSVKDGEVLGGTAPLHIETNRLTLASLCKSQGYRTAAFGKWHLGLGSSGRIDDWSIELKPGPLEIGFDHFFGMGSNPWTGPHSFIEDHHVLGRIPGMPVRVTGGRENASTSGIEKPFAYDQITEQLTDKAVAWIAQKSDRPFFLYFAHTAVHRPVAPHPKFKGSHFGIYGDFIEELDGSVGRVLNALDHHGLASNTLVIFTSDNGGVTVNTAEHAVAQQAGLKINGDLRGGKHSEWEGGFREPFLVRWPGHVPASTVSDQVICLTDTLATIASILNVPLPRQQAEDSFNVLRAFTEEKVGPPVRDHVILQSADAVYTIREGDWKLVERIGAPHYEPRNQKKAKAEAKRKQAGTQDELFNLKTDPAEAKNVLAEHPDRAAAMKKRLVQARQAGHTRPEAGD